MDVSCIVLAGGKSKRLGRNKLVEVVGKQKLIERVISTLEYFRSEIIIVSAPESSLPQLNEYNRLRFVQDIYPGKGSLGGVFTGLTASHTLKNVVVACDMPFLNPELLHYMAGISEDYDAVIPKHDNDVLEPLHAIYSKNCLTSMQLLLEQNRLSILEVFPLVRTRYIHDTEIDKFDPQRTSFFNINTETELQAGRRLIGNEGTNYDQC